MSPPRPHFLLFCDGSYPNQNPSSRGRWRFVLEDVEGGDRMEAGDAETNLAPDRVALLAVVRGLEALEQPSRVTMVTSSRYVQRGMQYGLPEWRENEYCWEHFGAQQPIRNADLWRRIDRALQYHSVHCRLMAGDEATTPATPGELEWSVESAEGIRVETAQAESQDSNPPSPPPSLPTPPLSAPLGRNETPTTHTGQEKDGLRRTVARWWEQVWGNREVWAGA